jgi:hypothetical protein
MNTVTMSAVIVTLFFGGPQPLKIAGNENVLAFLGPFSGTVWFFLKLLVFLYIYVWFRATLPRLRYDQLMDLGWKVMIPIALGWFLLLALLRVGGDRGWTALHKTTVGVIALLVLVAAGGLLTVGRQGQRPQQGTRGGDVLMGYLDGFLVTDSPASPVRRQARHHFVLRWPRCQEEGRRRRGGPRRQDRQAGASARPPRAQPLRRRHGEVHRL